MNPRLHESALRAKPCVLRMQSDERLVELAQDGSEAAFESIVARHRRALVRDCARVIGDADAEDAVQAALLKAHAALARGEVVRTLEPWLHAVAHNTALNMLRARAARPAAADDGLHWVQRADDSLEQRESLREVLDAVRMLPRRQRDAIVMRELEGRSYAEIATRLGASHGAVRELLSRARIALRSRVAGLSGIEQLVRWLMGSGNGLSAGRVGAISGGCAMTIKICTVALMPAVVAQIKLAPIPLAHAGHRVEAVARSSVGRREQPPTTPSAPSKVDSPTRGRASYGAAASRTGTIAVHPHQQLSRLRMATLAGAAESSSGGRRTRRVDGAGLHQDPGRVLGEGNQGLPDTQLKLNPDRHDITAITMHANDRVWSQQHGSDSPRRRATPGNSLTEG